jgi:hypothetical protein
MGRQLKKFTFDDGTVTEEKVCEEYVCAFCGAKAVACNFVGGMCLQVHAQHTGLCGAYIDNEKYSGYISDCTTCRYQTDTGGRE